MSKSTMTLIGLYKWDSDLFKNLTLPNGLDRETAINSILLRAGDFEVMYPDFDFMEEMIGVISKKWQRTFQKWFDAMQLEYAPIENYDRHEEWTDSGSDTGTVKHGTTRNSTEGVTGSSSDQSHSDSMTDTYVSTYDSNSLNQDNESKSNQSANSSGTTKQDTTQAETSSDDETRNLANSSQHSGHVHGNIGVTTSQQMLQAELDIDYWNLYEHIADVFVGELCIPVY